MRIRRTAAGRRRVAAPPPGGASSFHLWWRLPAGEPLVEVRATCEVVVPPAVDELYFWALQVGFHDGRRSWGAGHAGLQWHRTGERGRAVNWGGYHAPEDGGAELAGRASGPLPRLNPSGNTMRYPWQPGRPYRFRVRREDHAWRADVLDLATAEETVIRDLHAPGPYLVEPLVWSEVFAPCDAPSVTVRWSDLMGVTASGSHVRPHSVALSFQRPEAGGCPNTTVEADEGGLLQITNVPRRVRDGDVVPVPGRLT